MDEREAAEEAPSPLSRFVRDWVGSVPPHPPQPLPFLAIVK